jgi:hypothetical protein
MHNLHMPAEESSDGSPGLASSQTAAQPSGGANSDPPPIPAELAKSVLALFDPNDRVLTANGVPRGRLPLVAHITGRPGERGEQ